MSDRVAGRIWADCGDDGAAAGFYGVRVPRGGPSWGTWRRQHVLLLLAPYARSSSSSEFPIWWSADGTRRISPVFDARFSVMRDSKARFGCMDRFRSDLVFVWLVLVMCMLVFFVDEVYDVWNRWAFLCLIRSICVGGVIKFDDLISWMIRFRWWTFYKLFVCLENINVYALEIKLIDFCWFWFYGQLI